MQSLTQTLSPDITVATEKKAFDWQLLLTVSILILCGSFTYATYSPPVNAAALSLIVGLFYYSLQRNDPISFFIQLFIGNFFIFGNKFGGNYNIAALSAVVFYTAINGRISFLRPSTLDGSSKTALLIWIVFDLLSVTGGNHFPVFIEFQNFFAFCMMLYLVYFVSRIPFTPDDYYKIIVAIAIFFVYEFLIAANQKNEWYSSPFPFFPSTDKSIEFDMGIVRSGSTLNNFEAFAESCVSLMCLLIPGILSGSLLKKSKPFYYFGIVSIVLALMSIVYSGTRSSILLLPIAIAGSCFMLGKRLNLKFIILFIVAVGILAVANVALKFVDLSVFEERSEDMDNISVTSVLNGDALNRGGLFPYAFKQMGKTNGFFGRGYFVSPDEYRYAHFANQGNLFDGISDYHNLYMSSFVMWGPIAFFAMMFLFFHTMYKGWKTYWAARHQPKFTIDLLLGFNLLFIILMINQFKIQFIRDINYFTVIMLLLALYSSLTSYVQQTVEDNP